MLSYSWRIEYCGILSNPGPVDSSLNNVHFIVHEMRFPRVDFIMQSKDIKNCFICEVHHKFNSLLEGFPNAGVIANKWIVSVDTTHTCKHSQVPVLMEPVHHVPTLAISRSSFCGLWIKSKFLSQLCAGPSTGYLFWGNNHLFHVSALSKKDGLGVQAIWHFCTTCSCTIHLEVIE